MPSGVFRPYTGVSTAVLLFTKGASTGRVWFYDMQHDGFSLDDKRLRVLENDSPDLLDSWANRANPDFRRARDERVAELRRGLEPLKQRRLRLTAAIHQLRFEEAVAEDADDPRAARRETEAELAALQSQIAPLAGELNRLSRQFSVEKAAIADHNYDLSASTYRSVEHDEVFIEPAAVTLERLQALEATLASRVARVADLLPRT